MPKKLPHLALALLALCLLPACNTITAPPTAAPPSPVIAGDWSQPVNGVRMGVRQIVSGSADAGVWLLVLIENTTTEEVYWPGVRAEIDVRFAGVDTQEHYTSLQRNLRIVVEPLDGQPLPGQYQFLLEELQQLFEPLAPHEVRIQAIRFHDSEMTQELMQQSPNYIYADSVLWPGLEEADAVGDWRLHLTYQPGGFEPPPGEEWERAELGDIYDDWEDVQIDLPPLEVEVWPRGGSQSREELRER